MPDPVEILPPSFPDRLRNAGNAFLAGLNVLRQGLMSNLFRIERANLLDASHDQQGALSQNIALLNPPIRSQMPMSYRAATS